MSKREDILVTAERLFYRGGFHGTGVDRIVAEARVTPRTLYRHFRSKEELVRVVLARREERFLGTLEEVLDREAAGEPQRWARLFASMEQWFGDEGAQGCMFLKALGEYDNRDEAIATLVRRHKRRVLDGFRRRLEASELADAPGLAEGLMLLIEGAVALAPVLGGREASRYAASAAARLIDAAAETPRPH